jgi:hypothetical protein
LPISTKGKREIGEKKRIEDVRKKRGREGKGNASKARKRQERSRREIKEEKKGRGKGENKPSEGDERRMVGKQTKKRQTKTRAEELSKGRSKLSEI